MIPFFKFLPSASPAQLRPPAPSCRRRKWRAPQLPPPSPQPRTRRRDSDGGRPNGQAAAPSLPQLQEEEEAPERPAHVKYELRDSPGLCKYSIKEEKHACVKCCANSCGRDVRCANLSCFLSCVAVPLVIYGFQHYISMVGSIILIPLVMVPAMGGSAVSAALIL